jgi:hypothetical protein
VSSLALGFIAKLNAGARVNDVGLLDDGFVLDELANVSAAVGKGDLIDIVGIQPDLATTAF